MSKKRLSVTFCSFGGYEIPCTLRQRVITRKEGHREQFGNYDVSKCKC